MVHSKPGSSCYLRTRWRRCLFGAIVCMFWQLTIRSPSTGMWTQLSQLRYLYPVPWLPHYVCLYTCLDPSELATSRLLCCVSGPGRDPQYHLLFAKRSDLAWQLTNQSVHRGVIINGFGFSLLFKDLAVRQESLYTATKETAWKSFDKILKVWERSSDLEELTGTWNLTAAHPLF